MAIGKNISLMYQVIENLKSMVRVIDEDDNIIYMNKEMQVAFGDKTGQKCYSILCHDEKCKDCIGRKSIETNTDQTKDIEYEGKHYRVIASPANIQNDNVYSIEFFQDITEQKKLEQEFLKHYTKLKGDIEFAKQVQEKALPDNGVYWNSLKLTSMYLPTEDLGGDIFDIVKIDEDNCIFYIADVSGHGVRSSLLTIFLRQVIRGLNASAVDPIVFIQELIKNYHNLKLTNEQYISVLCGIYNTKTRGLTLVNAGHNCPPLVIENNNKRKITEINIKGMPICDLLTVPNHEVKILQMEKGDRILLYTDGLTEAFSEKENREFGVEGIKKTIVGCDMGDSQVIVNEIIREAKDFAETSPIDDMALALIEIL